MTQTENKKTSKPTIAESFRTLGVEANKSKKILAEKMFAWLKERGVTRTKKHTLTKEICLRQINAMVADIKKERLGWWCLVNVVDDKKGFQLVVKKKA